MPQSPDFRYDVFLSYNAKDKRRVRQLAERLKAAGVRVWLDEWGDIIALDEGLEQSLVLLLVPNSQRSTLNSQPTRTAVHRDPANADRRSSRSCWATVRSQISVALAAIPGMTV